MRMCVGSMKESRKRCYRWKYELEVIGYEGKEEARGYKKSPDNKEYVKALNTILWPFNE